MGKRVLAHVWVLKRLKGDVKASNVTWGSLGRTADYAEAAMSIWVLLDMLLEIAISEKHLPGVLDALEDLMAVAEAPAVATAIVECALKIKKRMESV